MFRLFNCNNYGVFRKGNLKMFEHFNTLYYILKYFGVK